MLKREDNSIIFESRILIVRVYILYVVVVRQSDVIISDNGGRGPNWSVPEYVSFFYHINQIQYTRHKHGYDAYPLHNIHKPICKYLQYCKLNRTKRKPVIKTERMKIDISDLMKTSDRLILDQFI